MQKTLVLTLSQERWYDNEQWCPFHSWRLLCTTRKNGNCLTVCEFFMLDIQVHLLHRKIWGGVRCFPTQVHRFNSKPMALTPWGFPILDEFSAAVCTTKDCVLSCRQVEVQTRNSILSGVPRHKAPLYPQFYAGGSRKKFAIQCRCGHRMYWKSQGIVIPEVF